jgi:hypothetical protein
MPDSVFFADMIVTYRTSTLGFGRRLLLFSVRLQWLARTMMFCTPYDAESDRFGGVAGEFDLWSVALKCFDERLVCLCDPMTSDHHFN